MSQESAAGSSQEYRRRLELIQSAMGEAGCDVVVAGDNGAFSPPAGNVRYLSDFSIGSMQNVVDGGVVVVPRSAAPTLVLPRGPEDDFLAWARESSWIPDVVSATGMTPPAVLEETIDVLRRAKLDRARIGVSGGLGDLRAIAAELPSATVDRLAADEDPFVIARRLKSPFEIARLQAAQRAAEAGMLAFMEAAQPDARHVEAIAEGDLAAMRAGAEASLTIMNCGSDPWMWWSVQGERRFVEGRIVTLETNARTQGYVAQFARSGVLGVPNERQAEQLAVALESVEALVAEARPGVTAAELAQAGLAPLAEHGFRNWSQFGHGVGMTMNEPPAIVDGDDTRLEVGMSIVLHASVFDPVAHESMIIGEQYIVEAGGVAPLSPAAPSRELAPASPSLASATSTGRRTHP